MRHLPDPPLALFDSDLVDASGEAYRWGHVPDAALGVANQALTLVLAAAGGADRSRRRPWLPVFLAAKAALDAAASLYLTAEQLSTHRPLCPYCLLAAGASLVAAPATLPEARAALAAGRGSLRAGRLQDGAARPGA